MGLIPLEDDPLTGKQFANDHSLELGHTLPLTERVFKEYFPSDQSYLFRRGKKLAGIFSARSGRDKHSPTMVLRLVADSPTSLKMIVEHAMAAAIAQEKHVIRTSVFGYESKKLALLKSLGLKVGASLPGTISFDGGRYDYHVLFKDLTGEYNFSVKRGYAGAGLYPSIEVERKEKPRLAVRGYRKQDRSIIDGFASHENVIRGIASGIFGGLAPWPAARENTYDSSVDTGRIVPLVCEDAATKEPVGILDLSRPYAEVMQISAMLGMLVRAEYQGMGAGTMLMDAMKKLARRMHLARVWLTVYEGNVPAQKLYRKVGFEESGRIPGWILEGYVNEVFMTLKLD